MSLFHRKKKNNDQIWAFHKLTDVSFPWPDAHCEYDDDDITEPEPPKTSAKITVNVERATITMHPSKEILNDAIVCDLHSEDIVISMGEVKAWRNNELYIIGNVISIWALSDADGHIGGVKIVTNIFTLQGTKLGNNLDFDSRVLGAPKVQFPCQMTFVVYKEHCDTFQV